MKNFKRVLSFALALLMVVGSVVVAPVDAKAAETADHVVIHEVYGGGGNSGALYTNDYIVLYNPTDAVVSLEGWSVQYTSATGTFSADNTTPLTGTIEAKGYYLIQQGAGSTVKDKPLPITPGATDDIAMGKDKGVLALSKSTAVLSGKTDDKLVDLVGFGSTATTYEGNGPAPAPSNTKSIQRGTLGVDSNDNSADFKAVTPDLSYLTGEGGGEEDDDKEDDTPTYTTPEEIVNAAYALEKGATLEGGPYTLTGIITSVDTEYSSQFKNVTVTIQVGNMADKLIQCFRLKGTGADTIAVGDTITVTGTLKNYNGTIEFDAGCTLDAVKTAKDIVDEAYALASGKSLSEKYTLIGVITSVDTEYSSQFKNVTVTIQVGDMADKLIQCYRLKGTGADVIAAGDTIRVTGTLKNYNGTIEFDAGCTLDAYTVAEKEDDDKEDDTPTYTTPEEIVNAAYALEAGATLPGGPYTLTGIITSVDTAYSSDYKNITVTMQVGEMKDKPIQCFRLKGTDAEKLGVGDEITVTGTLKNYNGKIEFDAGCTLDSYKDNPDPTPADIEVPADATDEEIVALAQTLVPGQSLVGKQTLTGIITNVDSPYDANYGNVTITIQVGATEETQILVYRVKGEGADVIAKGDTVTVSGTITNYKGTIEFTSGCTIDSYTLAEIDKKGDLDAMTTYMILFAGVALVAVAYVGKRKMA